MLPKVLFTFGYYSARRRTPRRAGRLPNHTGWVQPHAAHRISLPLSSGAALYRYVAFIL